MAEPKLKACPFCGEKARIRVIRREYTGDQYIVGCQSVNCFGRNSRRWDDLERAVRAWNRREEANDADE